MARIAWDGLKDAATSVSADLRQMSPKSPSSTKRDYRLSSHRKATPSVTRGVKAVALAHGERR